MVAAWWLVATLVTTGYIAYILIELLDLAVAHMQIQL